MRYKRGFTVFHYILELLCRYGGCFTVIHVVFYTYFMVNHNGFLSLSLEALTTLSCSAFEPVLYCT